MVAIVIVFVPVTLLVPAMLVLIPPAMELAPTALARLAQLVPPPFCILAPRPIFIDRNVQQLIRSRNPALAFLFALRMRSRDRRHSGKS